MTPTCSRPLACCAPEAYSPLCKVSVVLDRAACHVTDSCRCCVPTSCDAGSSLDTVCWHALCCGCRMGGTAACPSLSALKPLRSLSFCML